jgi:hypothetical protein
MKEIKWVKVAETNGITPAQLLAGRLQAADIPARAVQEGAGQAYGLTVGLLGTARVLVPEERLEEARALLDLEAEVEEDELVACPHCDSEVELDDAEWEQGWFECPVCGESVDLDRLF